MEATQGDPVKSSDDHIQPPVTSSATGCVLPCSVVVAIGLVAPGVPVIAFVLFFGELGFAVLMYLLMGGGGIVGT